MAYWCVWLPNSKMCLGGSYLFSFILNAMCQRKLCVGWRLWAKTNKEKEVLCTVYGVWPFCSLSPSQPPSTVIYEFLWLANTRMPKPESKVDLVVLTEFLDQIVPPGRKAGQSEFHVTHWGPVSTHPCVLHRPSVFGLESGFSQLYRIDYQWPVNPVEDAWVRPCSGALI